MYLHILTLKQVLFLKTNLNAWAIFIAKKNIFYASVALEMLNKTHLKSLINKLRIR